MDINRLTQKSLEAVQDAQSKAALLNHQEVDVEHLFLSLLEQDDSLIKSLLERMGFDAEDIIVDLDSHLNRLPRVTGAGIEPGKVYITRRLNQLLALAEQEADRLKDAYISVDFLEKKAEVIRMKDAPENPTPFDMIIENAEGEKNQILFEYPNIQPNNAILDELNSFADAITGDKNVEVSLEDGTEALKVALEIMKLISQK